MENETAVGNEDQYKSTEWIMYINDSRWYNMVYPRDTTCILYTADAADE